jgi:hypothetical protein
MSRMLVARCLTAAVLGLGACAGFSRAGDPPAFPHTPNAATELPPGYPPVDNSPVKHPVWERIWNGRPLGCWASFNGYSCSSLHSALVFGFGSCRSFFGQPCLKGPPPSALPPWAGQESGYYPGGAPTPGLGLPPLPGYPSGGRPGCGCP